MCVCVGGGGTLVFSCIQRLGSFFGVKNFEFHIFGSFQKKKLGGTKILWIFLGGSSQNWTIFRDQFYTF